MVRYCCGLWACALGGACLLLAGCAASRKLGNARSDESHRLVQQAHQAEDRGDGKAAQRLLAEAVESNPSNCETRLELSEFLVQQGSLRAAEQHLMHLVEKNPDDPRGYIRLAQVRFHDRRYPEARQALDTALEIDPMHTQGLLLRGKLQELDQRDDAALETYHRAMLSDTEQVEAELRLAAIHVRKGNPQQAAPLLRSVIESARACPLEKSEATWLLATAYAQEERWSDAAATFAAATPTRRMSSRDWEHVAYAHYRVGDWSQAAAATDAALELAPQSERALNMRNFLQSSPTRLASIAQAASDVRPAAAP